MLHIFFIFSQSTLAGRGQKNSFTGAKTLNGSVFGYKNTDATCSWKTCVIRYLTTRWQQRRSYSELIHRKQRGDDIEVLKFISKLIKYSETKDHYENKKYMNLQIVGLPFQTVATNRLIISGHSQSPWKPPVYFYRYDSNFVEGKPKYYHSPRLFSLRQLSFRRDGFYTSRHQTALCLGVASDMDRTW